MNQKENETRSSASFSLKTLKTVFQWLLIQNERTKTDCLKLLCSENLASVNKNVVHCLYIRFESLCCACNTE